MTPAGAVEALLGSLPRDRMVGRIAVSLASGDLACDDTWTAPPGLRAKDVRAIAPVLLEARSAGETLEGLSADFSLEQGNLTVVAVDTRVLAELREAVAKKNLALDLVTSIPAAVACAVRSGESCAFVWGRQHLELSSEAGRYVWRSVPADGAPAEPQPPVMIDGLSLAPEQLPAIATALCDPEMVPCALRGAPDAPRSFGERFRTSLLFLSGAAAVLLLAVGFHFRAQDRRFGVELAQADRFEADLWKRHFPGRTRVPGEFLRMAKERIRDSGVSGIEGGVPSVFLLLMDLARHLPEAEGIGMTLESLDLSPEGGRMTATVAAVQGDALRNAALLEGKISESSRISARGDFEARQGDVQVRLKMDWRSR
jgi:hypothetical protein